MSPKTKREAEDAAPDREQQGTVQIWRIGKYEILRELGRGAMGQVYEARHPVMDKTVAIKVFRAGAAALVDQALAIVIDFFRA